MRIANQKLVSAIQRLFSVTFTKRCGKFYSLIQEDATFWEAIEMMDIFERSKNTI